VKRNKWATGYISLKRLKKIFEAYCQSGNKKFTQSQFSQGGAILSKPFKMGQSAPFP